MDPNIIFSRHFAYFKLMGIDLYPSDKKWKKWLSKLLFCYFWVVCIQHILFGGYYLMFSVSSMESFTDTVAALIATVDTIVKLVNFGFQGRKCIGMINFLMIVLNDGNQMS